MLAVCCDPCATCQELREIDLRSPQIMHPGGMMPPGAMVMMNPMVAARPMVAPPGNYYVPPGAAPMQQQQQQHYPMQAMQPQYGQPGFNGGMTPMPMQQQQVSVYSATVQPLLAPLPPPQVGVPVAGYAAAYPADKSKY